MTRPLALVSLLSVVLISPTLATDWGPYVGDAEFESIEASVLVTPAGVGPGLDEVHGSGGFALDATIRIQVVDGNGQPIAGYPGEDIWLGFAVPGGTARGCRPDGGVPGGVFLADADTDADGWTEFRLPLRGGGWSEGPATLYLGGSPAHQGPWFPMGHIPLRMNSPDINGDLRVDLADVALFAQDFYSGTAPYRSDFFWDGQLDLADVVRFVPHLGEVCE